MVKLLHILSIADKSGEPSDQTSDKTSDKTAPAGRPGREPDVHVVTPEPDAPRATG